MEVTLGVGASDSSSLLRLDVGLMVWTWISFLIVLYVLNRYAYKPMLFLVHQREKQIKDNLAKAEEARARAEAAAQERARLLAEAQEEARRIVEAAREAAEGHRRRILDEARQDAARIISNAKREIEAERRNAMRELSKTVADLAVEAASRILAEELDETKHRALIERVIAELEQTGG